MPIVIGGKHFGQYTYEHWFDDDFESETERVIKARKGINPVGICGRHCDHCGLAQWCGGCRSNFNCCSFAASFKDEICPNVKCTGNKDLRGCYECCELADCETGYYAKNDEYTAKAAALFIKKHGEECYSKTLKQAVGAGEEYPKTFDSAGSVDGALKILEKYIE